MNGNATITLMDSTGTVVSTQQQENLVTPALVDFLKDLANWYDLDGGYNQDSLRSLASTFTGTNNLLAAATFGLALYNTTLNTTNLQGYVTGKQPTAYAGSTVASPSADHGTFVSSSTIYNDASAAIGIKLVWDFPLASANGDIAALCLVPRELCDNVYSRIYSHYSLTNMIYGRIGTSFKDSSSVAYYPNEAMGLCTAYYTNGYSGRVRSSLSDKAKFLFTEDSAHKVTRKRYAFTTTGVSTVYDTQTVLSIAGFTDVFKVLDDGMNNQYIGFGTAPSGNRAVVYVDKDTGLSTSIQEVSCINALAIVDWGLCGDKLIVVTNASLTTAATNVPVLNIVDLSENTYTNINITQGETGAYVYAWSRVLLTYRTIEGDFACDLHYPTISSGSIAHNWNNFVELYVNSDGDVVVGPYAVNVTINDGVYTGTPFKNIGLRPTCLINTPGYTYEQPRSYMGMGFARRTLFTICNLDTPITKTSAQVLRVTYDLTWGE